MILYFADRHLNILGQATTHLPEGVRIANDLKTEDVETGVSIFECDIHFDRKTRSKVSEWAKVGNYILRSNENEAEFYNIIDSKEDTKKQKVYIYAEDDGLDLLNDVVGAFEADEYYPIDYYVERVAADAGWKIGINEVEGLTRKLSWTHAQTASERLLSIAEAFNNCELSYSFEIKGLQISKKYINIYEKRGKDTGVQLRLNKEIDSIITTESIANLATALVATGDTPEGEDEPITLLGYQYDDEDFYVDGEVLKSRKALEEWSRYLWKTDDNEQLGGHIVKQYSFETTSQAVLCENAIAELKKICNAEVNYEVDILKLPDNVKVGDRVNIIDDEGELYLSSRVLILETSVSDQTRKAVLGEHLIRKSGISSKVTKLAAQFAKQTVSVKRATKIANNANKLADSAVSQAAAAGAEAKNALSTANKASASSDAAVSSATIAQAQAQAAQAAVGKVEESVSSIEKAVENAEIAANLAEQAATTATQKAEEAKTAAENAVEDASEAKTAAENAQSSATSAIAKAEEAIGTAGTAKSTAEAATATAIAAKLDAEQAEKDVATFAENLEKVTTTMEAEYARKTDLTETTANLQTQITQSAAAIESSAYKLMVIDETANNAESLLDAADKAADEAKKQAATALATAAAAQNEADTARAAANEAQADADAAKAAYKTAKGAADKAKAALLTAEKDLATISARADATEEEIAAAEAALASAQTAADEAQASADAAAKKATNAVSAANAAVTTADKAQAAADDAANQADLAQAIAEEAKGNAEAAKTKSDEAKAAAEIAQQAAKNAKDDADNAQTTAENALKSAMEAQATAADAQETLRQANDALDFAQLRLAEVRANVDATAEEIAAAQADVDTAQAAVNEAKASADAAQATANEAKAAADAAQDAANEAKAKADAAQEAAEEAQKAVDIAEGYVYALEKRTVEVEAKIKQNAESISLSAKKTEVAEALNNIKIGSRNYFARSQVNNLAWWKQSAEFPNGKFVESSSYRGFSFAVNEGEQWTIYRTGNNNNRWAVYWCNTEPAAEVGVTGCAFRKDGQAANVVTLLTVPAGVTWGFVYLSSRGDEVPDIMLEKGNKATDWAPALEDMASKTDVTEVASKLTVEAGEIKSTVEEVQKAVGNNAAAISEAKSEIQQLSDSIITLVKDDNGQTKMTQDSSGWEFDFATLEDTVKKHSTKFSQYDDYVNITTRNSKPCIELGETSNDNKVLITNEDIRFQVGSKTPTYISDDILVTEKIKVEDELNQNGWVWKTRSNGNFGLSWEGG